MLTILDRDDNTLEDNNICLLNGDIDGNTSEYVTRFLLEKTCLKEDKRPEFVKLIVNSVGGELNHGFAIIDLIKSIDIPVHTYGLGQIYSCGLLIFMAGDPGNRHIFKNCSILSHQWSGMTLGKEHELKASEKDNKMTTLKILKLYESCTGLSKAEIEEKLLPAADVYLTPRQAIDFHIGDKIVTKF